jgi:hypothetical protein
VWWPPRTSGMMAVRSRQRQTLTRQTKRYIYDFFSWVRQNHEKAQKRKIIKYFGQFCNPLQVRCLQDFYVSTVPRHPIINTLPLLILMLTTGNTQKSAQKRRKNPLAQRKNLNITYSALDNPMPNLLAIRTTGRFVKEKASENNINKSIITSVRLNRRRSSPGCGRYSCDPRPGYGPQVALPRELWHQVDPAVVLSEQGPTFTFLATGIYCEIFEKRKQNFSVGDRVCTQK